jgi:phenylacetic acid degradation operon negative regulatory protein
MTQVRKVDDARRPLTARSVIASTLLGTEGLTLPVPALVRAGELFGIAEGTTRVALSRMVAGGELVTEPGRYRLSGHLVERSLAQHEGRHPQPRAWSGRWQLAIVTAERRPPAERAALRKALARLHLAEWREGVWLRPDNLGPPDRLPEAARVAGEQCTWVSGALEAETKPAELAGQLWDLEGWSVTAGPLLAAMAKTIGPLEAGDTAVLRDAFLLAAAVLRQVSADPLLPDELLPARWPGSSIREQYDRYEAALQSVLRTWFRSG